MNSVVYDARALIAADRSDRRRWAEHRVLLEVGLVPEVPAPVVAQVSRSPKQAQLRRFLRGCEIVPMDGEMAHAAGALLGKACAKDVVDASVAILAIGREADVVSDDASDLRRIFSAARAKIRIIAV